MKMQQVEVLPECILTALDLLAHLGQMVYEAQEMQVADSGSLGGVALSASERDNRQRSSSNGQFYREPDD